MSVSQVLIQSLRDWFSWLSLAPSTISLVAPCPRRMRRGHLAIFALSGLNWIQMEPKWIHTLCYTHSHSQGAVWSLCYARVMFNDAFSIYSRQLSSVWKNAWIFHPLANGRLLPRATTRSKVLSLMQLWFAVAITSSLTSHWSHFQVRPAWIPSFSERVSLGRNNFFLPFNIPWA